jgi:hypothetical protein
MTGGRTTVLELTRMEAAHLAGLVAQFEELIQGADDGAPNDPAIARLVPDGYTGDPEAAQEFRELTQRDLLDRRESDAARVLATLHETPGLPQEGTITDPSDEALLEVMELRLDPEDLQAWLRTLAALRLVLASRLGIKTEEDHDADDPRFGIYDWLGYRLDGLVSAADEMF